MAEGSVNLRVLSPSSEVEGGVVNLADVPATTTIGELRQRIHDAAPTKPATDRMRLIYRGRVVANDSDTLANVLGADNIRESKDQSLHMVLRELPSAASAPSPVPRSATAPPNPLQPSEGPPQSPLQANPFRTLEPRPHSQPQVPQPHHHHYPRTHPHHHHHHPPPLNPFGARPIPLPPQLQFTQAAMNQNAQPPNQTGTPVREEGTQGAQGPPQPPMGLPNLPAGATRAAVRQEGIGPNGERWTVTAWNNTAPFVAFNPNAPPPVLPRPFPHPGPAFGFPGQRAPSPALGNMSDQMLERIRRAMLSANQEMENVRILLQPPGGQAASVGALAASNPPVWRVDRIRQSVRSLITSLDNVDRGLASLVADPLMVQNRDVVWLQQSASDLRRQAEEFGRLLDQLPRSESPDPPSSAASPASGATSGAGTSSASTQTQHSTQSSAANVPTEFFILSSPEGPVGILFDQRGTYTTAPAPMPFQSFSEQFNLNRQHVGLIGRQLGLHAPQNHLGGLRPPAVATGPQPPPVQQPNLPNPAPQPQNQNQNVNRVHPVQPAAAAAAAAAAVPEQRRANGVDNVAGHLWLIFKLAVFVYFFAGGGGWYRPIVICLVAFTVYVAQIGIMDDHFATMRHYLAQLLPAGTFDLLQDNPRPQPRRPAAPTPEQAAQRLQQQQRERRFGWVRESIRTTERAFAIFLASLWPGIGERMVQVQEERARAERAAEEERRAAEEARRIEEERRRESEKVKEESAGAQGEAEASGSKDKGKEKMARVEDEGVDGEVD